MGFEERKFQNISLCPLVAVRMLASVFGSHEVQESVKLSFLGLVLQVLIRGPKVLEYSNCISLRLILFDFKTVFFDALYGHWQPFQIFQIVVPLLLGS